MPAPLPAHAMGLMAYLRQPNEKANEDLAISFFRKLFGETFTRQKEARQSDGYVAGSFVLELKGETKNWLSGLFQGLAYKNLDLDFGQIVVASKSFLAVWSVEDLPQKIREEVAAELGAPSTIGRKFARRYASQRTSLLKLATWNGADLVTPLFVANPDLVLTRLKDFESVLRKGRRVRRKITLGNFTANLREMKTFFDPGQPIKAVRAFYSMLYPTLATTIITATATAMVGITIDIGFDTPNTPNCSKCSNCSRGGRFGRRAEGPMSTLDGQQPRHLYRPPVPAWASTLAPDPAPPRAARS